MSSKTDGKSKDLLIAQDFLKATVKLSKHKASGVLLYTKKNQKLFI
jgi:hypothetical protein